jgi:peptidoglycan LD-endopeptidase CwlK
MPKFSQTSLDRLKTCHRDLQVLFNHVILEYDCLIVCGQRGEKEQNDAFDKGHSKLRFPNSKHNSSPSMAVDVVPYEQGIDWGKLQSAHFAGYVKGIADQLYRIGTIKHHIRFGIDWNSNNDIDDTTFWDANHFELIL